jgi:hypothetical protein
MSCIASLNILYIYIYIYIYIKTEHTHMIAIKYSIISKVSHSFNLKIIIQPPVYCDVLCYDVMCYDVV